VFIGTGVVATAVTTDAQSGLWQVAIVWGFAVTLAIFAGRKKLNLLLLKLWNIIGM
jgi:glycerol uptake facilitator-like aquaporin